MGKTRTSNERQQSNEKQKSCESVKIGRLHKMEKTKTERLQWILDDAVARGEIPGATLLVRKDGKEEVYLDMRISRRKSRWRETASTGYIPCPNRLLLWL